ncbi:MAG TPA: Lrp/AsnC family transcriptional regulator [Alphaproteobacteria bacterium]|nr:Lrp/AsnC family transcriptional regulator [Alphaproteobacteria bacterium]
MPKTTLDAIDCRIIAALQADGRLSNADLAQRVGLSPSPCLRRVNRLQREGYIETYRAMLRRKQIGLGLTVFVGVKIGGHADDRATAFEEAVIAIPEVIACHMIAGEVDYLLEVVVSDLEHYQHFLLDKLLNLSIVKDVRSSIAIQTLKASAPLPLDHLLPLQLGQQRDGGAFQKSSAKQTTGKLRR